MNKTDIEKRVDGLSRTLARLETKSSQIDQHVGGILHTERQSTKLTTIIISLLSIFLAGGSIIFNVWSTNRVDAFLQNSEDRIATIIGTSVPHSVDIFSPVNASQNTVVMEWTLNRLDNSGVPVFQLRGSTPVLFEINGPNGFHIGNQAYLSSNIVTELLAHLPDGARSNATALLTTPRFTLEHVNGVPVVENVAHRSIYSVFTTFRDCSDAQARLRQIITRPPRADTLFFRPVFRSIGNEPDFREFRISHHQNQMLLCEDFED